MIKTHTFPYSNTQTLAKMLDAQTRCSTRAHLSLINSFCFQRQIISAHVSMTWRSQNQHNAHECESGHITAC